MKKEAEEKRLIVVHQYEMQASWLSWGLDKMMKSDLGWQTMLYQYSQNLLKFVLNSQTNTLPTPDNLRRWKLKRNELCGLCGQQEVTLSHILAGCPWVPNVENKLKGEDRYKWRHNNVLLLIAASIKEQVIVAGKAPERKAKDPLIKFVRAGEAMKRSIPSKLKGLLSQARDWIVDFDLPEFRFPHSAYVFPHEVCATL